MDERKRQILSKMTKEQLFSLDRMYFTSSECQEIIDETRLTKLDRDIANLKVMKCHTLDEIGEILGRDKRTISKHWKAL